MYNLDFGIIDGVTASLLEWKRTIPDVKKQADALRGSLQGAATVGLPKVGKAATLANIGLPSVPKPNTEGFTSGLGEAGGAISSFKSQLSGLAPLVAGAFAIDKVTQFGSNVVETLSKFEKYEAVLTNTLGSGSAAKEILSGITDFAAKTPFQVDELTNSFVKFANQGFAPSLNEMTKLGDLASSTGKDFNQLAEAVIDAQVGEFERLKEFGIQAQKSNGKVAFTFKNQKKVVGESAAEIRKYLLSLGDMSGVKGAMDAISKTTGGQISNLKDQMDALYLSVGESLKPAISATLGFLTTKLTETVAWVKQNKAWIGAWINEFYEMGKAVGIAYLTFRTLTIGVAVYQGAMFLATNATGIFSAAQALLNAVLLANPIGLVIGALALLVGGTVYAWRKFEGFRGFLYGMWEVMKTFGTYIYDYAIRPLTALGEILIGVFTMDTALIQRGMNDALETIKINADNMLNAGTKLGASFNQGWNKGISDFRADNPIQSLVETSDLDRYYAQKDGMGNAFDYAKKKVGGKIDLGLSDSGKGKNADGNKQIKNVNITIQNLNSGDFNIITTKLEDSEGKIKEFFTRILLDATNQVNYQ